MITADFDVVVLGAGPAGLATALALRRRGAVSVLVADAGPPQRDRAGESTPPDLLVALSRLGLAERFLADGHVPSPGTASIWGRDRVGYNDFVLNPMGPSWRLDRGRFDRMLSEAVTGSGATLWWRTRFIAGVGVGVSSGSRGRHVLQVCPLEGGIISVRAGCVVDATGAGAYFARSSGVRRRIDDRLVALIRLEPTCGEAVTWQALIEAVPDGWWYAARVPGDRVIVMFVTDALGLRRFRSGGEEAFMAAAAATSLISSILPYAPAAAAGPVDPVGTVGAVRAAGPRDGSAGPRDVPSIRMRVLPVFSSALDQPAGDRWIAVGDAAASYDPIAGQGVYKALAAGIAAADHSFAIIDGSRHPADISDRQGHHDDEVADYRRNRADLYALEGRFPGASFWATRRARSATALRALPSRPKTGPAG